jgi:hypothetical protein
MRLSKLGILKARWVILNDFGGAFSGKRDRAKSQAAASYLGRREL